MPETIITRQLTASAHEVARGDAAMSGVAASIPIKDGKPDDTPVVFGCNESPRKDCWRLVHDGKKVVALFFAAGVTLTRHELFCGTEEECAQQIQTLSLDRTEFDANQHPITQPATPGVNQISDADLLAAVKSDPGLVRRLTRRSAISAFTPPSNGLLK